jgi:hypothetical protein
MRMMLLFWNQILVLKNKNLLPIAAKKDELKLLYSLDTLDYIKFDTLCALTTLEEKFRFTDLSRLSKCTFHFIGKYNNKDEYMVHRVYICSNLKSPFVVQQYDNIEAYNRYNNVMSRSPSFVIKQHVKFQEGEQYWLQPIICPPTKLKPRMVYCQEGEDDDDTTPTDTTIDYKVRLFLHLYSNFGSTCTCHYLNVGTNVSQSASPSKLKFRFVGSPIMLHWKGHNSSIQSAIEVNEHSMESLFDKLSNRSSPTSISHWQGLQIIEIFCCYFCRVLRRRRRLVIHTWDSGPSWSMPQEDGEHLRDAQRRNPPWPPP